MENVLLAQSGIAQAHDGRGGGGVYRREKSDRAAAPGELSALQQLQCCCGLGHSLSAQRAAMERVFKA